LTCGLLTRPAGGDGRDRRPPLRRHFGHFKLTRQSSSMSSLPINRTMHPGSLHGISWRVRANLGVDDGSLPVASTTGKSAPTRSKDRTGLNAVIARRWVSLGSGNGNVSKQDVGVYRNPLLRSRTCVP
jgi:hypothetical protein